MSTTIRLDRCDTEFTLDIEETAILTCPECDVEYEWLSPRTRVRPGRFYKPKAQDICPKCQAKARINNAKV